MSYWSAKSDLGFMQQFRADVFELYQHEGRAAKELRESESYIPHVEWKDAVRSIANSNDPGEELVVTGSQRRLGVGTALMRGVEDWGRTAGARLIWLYTDLDNEAARALYRALGYREVGVELVNERDPWAWTSLIVHLIESVLSRVPRAHFRLVGTSPSVLGGIPLDAGDIDILFHQRSAIDRWVEALRAGPLSRPSRSGCQRQTSTSRACSWRGSPLS